MKFVNIHTHCPNSYDEWSLRQGMHTWGIHPWDAKSVITELPPGDWWAIGECGLDALCDVSMSVQIEVFGSLVSLSQTHKLPLIIHCVKALPIMRRLKQANPTSLPWIYHGFRGKPSQMHEWIQMDGYLSFGHFFNEDSLRQCPIERLFLETDDKSIPIHDVYKRVAQVKEISIETLKKQVYQNFCRIWGNKINMG